MYVFQLLLYRSGLRYQDADLFAWNKSYLYSFFVLRKSLVTAVSVYFHLDRAVSCIKYQTQPHYL
jgi:hypothetical protein